MNYLFTYLTLFYIFNFFNNITSLHSLLLNPFVPNAHFLYPLKTSENLTVFCFQGAEKGYIGNQRVKETAHS